MRKGLFYEEKADCRGERLERNPLEICVKSESTGLYTET